MSSNNIQYRFHLYNNSNKSLKEVSSWHNDLYSAELATYSYLQSNPMTTDNTLYLVSNIKKKYNGVYLEDTYEIIKIIYGVLCKNSNNCYQLNKGTDLISRFENTMLFSEDEMIYKKARWISMNRQYFHKIDKIPSFIYNEYVCNPFHLKTLLYLGIDVNKIPWDDFDDHSDFNDYIKETVEYEYIWLSQYKENMLDLMRLAKDLQMLECKFNNVMDYFQIKDIFE